MQDDHLSISQVAKRTGKSEITIRRWIASLSKHDQKMIKRIGRKLYINEQLVSNHFSHLYELQTGDFSPAPGTDTAFLKMQEQLGKMIDSNAKKDDEIRQAWGMIQALREELNNAKQRIMQLEAGTHQERPDIDYSTPIAAALIVVIIALAVYLIVM
jgi:transcriptional regulator with XRE-family HTH domain